MAGVKNNRRTIYTKEQIKNSFLALLELKKLPQITVTEICKKADINRGTFYLHFKDPYELLEEMQKEFNKEILQALRKEQSAFTPVESLIQLLRIILEKRSIYRSIISEGRESNFLSEALLEIHKDYTHSMEMKKNSKKNTQLNYSFTFMAYGSMGVINQWLETNGIESPHEIALLIHSMTQYNSHIE